MTNERDKTDTDELVSETYRDLPAPRAPEHLNQSILRMAAIKAGGKKGLLFSAWMKPVAWAATIALSLAIVMDYSELLTTSVERDIVPVGESIRDEFTPQDADALEQAENRARSQIGADQPSVRADEPQEAPAEVVVEEVMLEDASPMSSEAKDKGKSNTYSASSPAAARPAARKLAAEQPSPDEAKPIAYLASSMEKKESDTTVACDAKARQSAEAWLECIDNLRESGAIEDADREYEAFILEYPAESASLESNK